MNYADKEWYIKSNGNGTELDYNVMSYYGELDEDDEVCNVWATDIHVESQMENLVLISRAPDMYRLLIECQKHLENLSPGNICGHKITKLMDELKKSPEEFIGDEGCD